MAFDHFLQTTAKNDKHFCRREGMLDAAIALRNQAKERMEV